VVIAPEAVWVGSGVFSRIDPATHQAKTWYVEVPAADILDFPAKVQIVKLAVAWGEVWALGLEPVGPPRAMERVARLYRVDPTTLRVVGQPLVVGSLRGAAYTALAVGEDALWVAHAGGLWRVDPSGEPATRTMPLPTIDVAVGDGMVWSVSPTGVHRLDPRSGTALATVAVPQARRLAIGGGAVWVATTRPPAERIHEPLPPAFERIDPQVPPTIIGWPPTFAAPVAPGNLVRIDPETATITARIALSDIGPEPPGPEYAASVARSARDTVWALAVGHGALWILRGLEDYELVRLDPRTLQAAAPIDLCRGGSKACGFPLGVVIAPEAVWVGSGVFSRIDPATHQAKTWYVEVPLASESFRQAFAVGDGALWIGGIHQMMAGFNPSKWRPKLVRWPIPDGARR
jgi:hypothetical protein